MKCANCGGTLRYDIPSYRLICDHVHGRIQETEGAGSQEKRAVLL